ncbi:bifunctional heptose 7-phosphate kinase/heptose 1-phosphate adenyltransferase [Methylophilaceae bacterium]|nr:bifunctional heptose 7-phosphate kinase/heptose 1-phosphate adenyltransferase [Methylophilaceae bacterium]
MNNNIIDIVSNRFNSKNKWGLVIGDIMLDRYISGDVKRLSPEASVPIVDVNENINKIGGAGNVALNLSCLGIKTLIVGEIGNDNSGKIIKDLFKENGISTQYLVKKKGATTTKTRIMGGQQQIVRLDYDEFSTGPNQVESKKILKLISNSPSAIIISDYEKGFLTTSLLKKIIKAANKKNIPVIIDPKGKNLEKYRGATAITPNKKEAYLLANLSEKDEKLLDISLKKLVKKYNFNFIAMTQGEYGIKHITTNKIEEYPTRASNQVFDVSGAGDTVIATLTASIIANLSLRDGFELANLAAGIVVKQIGTMPIQQNELLVELHSLTSINTIKKVSTIEDYTNVVKNLRKTDPSLVVGFTNGCFDIIHAGHVTYLAKAKAQVGLLIVALNSDSSVRKNKGASRPIVGEADRALVLCSLESVDSVILFDETTPLNLIKSIKPDILFKGNDYTLKNVVGAKEMNKWGGKVILIPVVQGKSSSKIIQKLS